MQMIAAKFHQEQESAVGDGTCDLSHFSLIVAEAQCCHGLRNTTKPRKPIKRGRAANSPLVQQTTFLKYCVNFITVIDKVVAV